MHNYYIYTFTDINGKVFYVGVTDNIERRYKQHLRDETSTDKFIWLKTNTHFMNVIDTAESKAEAELKETEFIKHYRKYNTLFNKQKVYTLSEKIKAAEVAAKARIKQLQKEGSDAKKNRKNRYE